MIPDWVPCDNCGKPYPVHLDGKCLFDTTQWAPEERVVLAALYRVRQRLAREKKTEMKHFNWEKMNPAIRVGMYHAEVENILVEENERKSE